ncbi:MAG: GNAT family N-acetyltransferase [Gemmatimonadaceae bacterium]|nr:GNAT family N-acetyltransferase [Gemmatimonadaceae bacterium]
MDGPLRVRAARPGDLESLVDFNCRLARETEDHELDPATVRRGLTRLFDNPAAGFYTVAEQEGRVVGCLLITFEWSDWRDGWLWWIQSVYVVEAARRLGVFRQLFEHVREKAETDGDVRGLRLYVERGNGRAQATYASMGMAEAPYKLYERYFP